MSQIENTVTGNDLIEKFGFDEYGLAYYTMKCDLAVVDPEQFQLWAAAPPTAFSTPEEFKRYCIDPQDLLDMIQDDPTGLKGKLFYIPETKNIPAYHSALPLRKPKDIAPQDGLRYMIESSNDLANKPNFFCLFGPSWAVKFKAEEFGIFSSFEKYRYIAELLAFYNQKKSDHRYKYAINSIHFLARFKPQYATQVEEVGTRESVMEDISPRSSEKDDEPQPDISSDFSETISVDEKNEIVETGNKLLRALKAATISGVHERIEQCDADVSFFRQRCLEQYGAKVSMSNSCKIVKIIPKVSKHIDNARQLVKNQTRNAIRDFEEEGMPKLSRHLRKSITVRTYEVEYSPEEPIDWYVKL